MIFFFIFMHINHENRYIAITLRLVACGVFLEEAFGEKIDVKIAS